MTAISEKNIIFPQINYQEKSIHFKWNGNDIVWTDGIVPIRIVK